MRRVIAAEENAAGLERGVVVARDAADSVKQLEEASAVSGARWLATQRRILIPLMLPALGAGFILLFIVGVREFTIPLVLYSPDNVVLSVLLWQIEVTVPFSTSVVATGMPLMRMCIACVAGSKVPVTSVQCPSCTTALAV